MNAQPRPTAVVTGLPEWPITLPMPDRDGYQYALGFGLVRTPFSGGSVRQRRTTWSMPASFSLSFRMNTAQLGIFQTFLDVYGYAWFSMLLVSGGARYVRPLDDCLEHRVRFMSDPMHAMIGIDLWRVTIQAEVEAMRDPRADQAEKTQFATVDEVIAPADIDDLLDFDTLSM